MATESFKINYALGPSLDFSSQAAVKRHLDQEQTKWEKFLDEVSNSKVSFSLYGTTISLSKQASSFDRLRNHLDDSTAFSKLTLSERDRCFPPPPHETLEGQLILGLFETGKISDAISVYLWLIFNCIGSNGRSNSWEKLEDELNTGCQLWRSAIASSVMPFSKVSSQKLAAVAGKAENQLLALNSKVAEADEININHSEELSDLRDVWTTNAQRIADILTRRERKREKKNKEWTDKTKTDIANFLLNCESRIQKADAHNQECLKSINSQWDRLRDLFETQLRLRAPVKLWEARATTHEKAANRAFWLFYFFSFIAIVIGVSVPFYAGDYIAESFFNTICRTDDANLIGSNLEGAINDAKPICERVFSAKGPLTITGLLLVTSLFLWITKLQYRVFLSERHLSLNASEKKAFAETFLAMKEGEDVGRENESLVLAALFRATQDGLIKEDDVGVNLSAAASLVKQLDRST